MDSLEKRLRKLPVAEPSPELKRRIFNRPKPSYGFIHFFQRPVQLRWALAWALAMGSIGYGLSSYMRSADLSDLPERLYEVHIVETAQPHSTFDLSNDGGLFLSGTIAASVEISEEI